MVAPPLHADAIGDITELTGYGRVVRDETFAAELDFDINSLDNVETSLLAALPLHSLMNLLLNLQSIAICS